MLISRLSKTIMTMGIISGILCCSVETFAQTPTQPPEISKTKPQPEPSTAAAKLDGVTALTKAAQKQNKLAEVPAPAAVDDEDGAVQAPDEAQAFDGMVIDPRGDVGINTLAPQYRLEVDTPDSSSPSNGMITALAVDDSAETTLYKLRVEKGVEVEANGGTISAPIVKADRLEIDPGGALVGLMISDEYFVHADGSNNFASKEMTARASSMCFLTSTSTVGNATWCEISTDNKPKGNWVVKATANQQPSAVTCIARCIEGFGELNPTASPPHLDARSPK